MIYYFYGPDSYRRNEKLKTSLAGYRKKYPTGDMMVLDLEENPDGWTKARDFLSQPSMFVDSKVLVVKESGEVPEKEEKEWIKTLKSELETERTFVFISDTKKPLKAFGFLLEPPVKKDSFGELEGKFLEAFVKKEASARGLSFEKSAWEYLINCLSSVTERSWVAVAELEKVFLSGFSGTIKLDDLKKTVNPVLNDEVFEVARKISWSRNWAEKMALLEGLFLQKKEAAYVFNSLAYIAKGKDIVRMADYDVAVKSGNMEYEEALLEFILP
jgi:DNA polymerase III delta subunit